MRPPVAPRRPSTAAGRPETPATGREVVPSPGRDAGYDLVIDDDLDDDDLDVDAPEPDDAPGGAAAPVRHLEPAYAAKARARRRVLWVRLASLAGAVALLALAGWIVLFSPVLALEPESVEVTGAGPYVDVAEVVAASAAQAGTPLPRVDTAAVREQVEAMPGVAEATVNRAFPRGLAVTVVPREPVALVPQGEESVQLVATDGVVIAATPPGEAPVGLPVLAVDLATPNAADSVNEVLTVLSAVPPELLQQIAQAGASGPRSVTFQLADGAEVLWGSAQESELKAAVLLTLLQVGASTYDVSEPETPITR